MDIRKQRTEQAIEACFLTLLEQKPASRITVTELCAGASINRATFYKHYLDIPDLQEQLEKRVLKDFEDFFSSNAFSHDAKYQTMLIRMLAYMKEYGRRFYLLCSGNAGSDLPAKTFQLFNEYVFPVVREKLPAVSEEKAALLYQYLTRGSGAVLTQWLRGASSMTEEELADFILRISGATMEAVEKGAHSA